MSEGNDSFNSLMMLGKVYNKPSAAGLNSLFIETDNDDNKLEVVIEREDDIMNTKFWVAAKSVE